MAESHRTTEEYVTGAEAVDRDNAIVRPRRAFLTARPLLYVSVILVVAVMAPLYRFRTDGIFSCPATGYAPGWYLAYCNASGYGDYEHGFFWFDLEPAVLDFAANANVLFLGNSRLQLAFSRSTTEDWFAPRSIRYYLLGFSYYENAVFTRELLRRLRPRAQAYVINVDDFFTQTPSAPAESLMEHSVTKLHYQVKRWWQSVHRPVCSSFPSVCGNADVVFRSRSNGAWHRWGRPYFSKVHAVSYDENVDHSLAATEAVIAKDFLRTLPVRRQCVILTMVPTVRTKIGIARSVAGALGMDLVAPKLQGLRTFDGSHLDRASAERWSAAFFRIAGARIRKCVHSAQSGSGAATTRSNSN